MHYNFARVHRSLSVENGSRRSAPPRWLPAWPITFGPLREIRGIGTTRPHTRLAIGPRSTIDAIAMRQNHRQQPGSSSRSTLRTDAREARIAAGSRWVTLASGGPSTLPRMPRSSVIRSFASDQRRVCDDEADHAPARYRLEAQPIARRPFERVLRLAHRDTPRPRRRSAPGRRKRWWPTGQAASRVAAVLAWNPAVGRAEVRMSQTAPAWVTRLHQRRAHRPLPSARDRIRR